jgi:uncharacterized membrane protein YvbJ
MFCGACGSQSVDGNHFCENCGRPFGGASAPTSPQNHGEAKPTQTGQAASVWAVRPFWKELAEKWQNGQRGVVIFGILGAIIVTLLLIHFFGFFIV